MGSRREILRDPWPSPPPPPHQEDEPKRMEWGRGAGVGERASRPASKQTSKQASDGPNEARNTLRHFRGDGRVARGDARPSQHHVSHLHTAASIVAAGQRRTRAGSQREEISATLMHHIMPGQTESTASLDSAWSETCRAPRSNARLIRPKHGQLGTRSRKRWLQSPDAIMSKARFHHATPSPDAIMSKPIPSCHPLAPDSITTPLGARLHHVPLAMSDSITSPWRQTSPCPFWRQASSRLLWRQTPSSTGTHPLTMLA
ncbi:hypothetical protein PMIN01_03695 [Paraphaeosphaeria minitans]|uniref:Uncharacterized protein n=1 Tax=Paraphaeosphaeria minitans TaxID=565426 RepID=A0A9P6KTK3_9PLEO|nr:hypothetical protein PMIN01_03695 [Paraphaeosphaeria minitans]